MLEENDELWHLPGSHPHWTESFYFNAFDGNTGWACATRIGATPHDDRRDGFICLYLPDGTTGFIATSEAYDDDRSPVASEGIEFMCIEPFRRWRIRYDGPIRHFPGAASNDDVRRTLDDGAPQRMLTLELEVTPVHAPFDYHERTVRVRPVVDMLRRGAAAPVRASRRALRALTALPSMMEAHHYEQSARVRGTVTLDGAVHMLEGLGQRDRSWGVRDMRVPSGWRWLSCQFGEELCFNATEVDVLALRVQGGFVLHDGVTEALASWRHDATHETSRFWPDQLGLELTTESGREVAIVAAVMTPLPVVVHTSDGDVVVTAARAQYRWDGRTADGMVEFMEPLR